MTIPAAETKSTGLQANAQLSWFLQRHLDSNGLNITHKGGNNYISWLAKISSNSTEIEMIIH